METAIAVTIAAIPGSPEAAPPEPVPLDLYRRVVVTRILDGDTIDVEIDLGFNVFTRQRIRLAGIDAPEKWTEDGKESKGRLEEMVRTHSPVYLEAGKKGKYGRWLGTFWGRGVNLNLQMVLEGHAKEYSGGRRSAK